MGKILEHKHLIITAKILNPPNNTVYIDLWMQKLVDAIGMKILRGPLSVYSDMKGNRGLTSVTIIETSHIALHIWDEEEPGKLQLDVYSCQSLDIDIVLDAIKEFEPVSTNYFFIDRDTRLQLIHEQNHSEE